MLLGEITGLRWKNKNTIKTCIKIEDTSESPDIAMTKGTERTEVSTVELLGEGSHSSKKRHMEETEHLSNKKSKTAVSSRALEKRGNPLAGVKVAMLKTTTDEPEHPKNPVHDKAGSSSSMVIKEPIVAMPPTGSELAPSDSQKDLDTLATAASAKSPLKLQPKVAGTAPSINISPNAPPKKPALKKVPTTKAPIVPPTNLPTATDAGTKSSVTVGEQCGAPLVKAATAMKARKPKVYVVPVAINAKNVCGREWLSRNPGGSKDDYETYFGGLTVAELNVFKKKSAEIKKKLYGCGREVRSVGVYGYQYVLLAPEYRGAY
ncbi:hypothetical protein EDD85DRAFT_958762 [Armillaria nabsnona]|nr:hypothetical protein EDD85DRAFT_958762 [Armillaria nabsnona]